MKMMPNEPTDEMIEELSNFRDYGGRAYDAYQDIYELAPNVEQDQSKRIAELESQLAECVSALKFVNENYFYVDVGGLEMPAFGLESKEKVKEVLKKVNDHE